MQRLACFVMLIAWMAVFTAPIAKADVVLNPQWAAEQVDGQVFWYYYWHGQKYHVDSAGQHWAILATMCVPVDNSVAPSTGSPVDNRCVPSKGGPIRQAVAGLHGRLANLAERLACR